MTRAIRPPEGWPWEQPGFKFLTDECRAWVDHARLTPDTKPKNGGALKGVARSREVQNATGTGWGTGFIPGMANLNKKPKEWER